MMKLSTMLKVDRTVDKEGQSPIAEHILEQWEHDQGSAQFFRSSTNFVYIFRKGGETCFLRFAESTERTRAEIEAEMALLNFLASQGMTVATPVVSKNGRCVATVETDLGTFHAVVFTQLPGREVEIEELSPAQFEIWGATLGKLHAMTHRYQDPKVAARGTWRDHLTLVRNAVPTDEPRVQAECDYLTSFLAALPVTEMNSGLIHGDFELDNLRWQDETLAMFGFDECAASWYIADVAFALRDLFETGVDLSHPSFRAFIRGYCEQYSLDEELLSHLPTGKCPTKWTDLARKRGTLPSILDTGTNFPGQNRSPSGTRSLKSVNCVPHREINKPLECGRWTRPPHEPRKIQTEVKGKRWSTTGKTDWGVVGG